MYRILSMAGYPAVNNQAKFLCDKITDIKTLPTQKSPLHERCGTGSTAICIEDKYMYVLSNEGKWEQLQNISGITNIITDSDNISIASVADVAEYIDV